MPAVRPDLPTTPATRAAVLTFIGLVLAFSWLRFIPPVLDERAGIELPAVLTVALLPLLGSFGPLLVALSVSAYVSGRRGVKALLAQGLRWRVGFSWYPIAVFGPALLYGIALVLLMVWGGQGPAFGLQEGLGVLSIFVAAFVFALGEQFGWRGYLQRALQSRRTALTAGLVVGLVWALWHAPLFVSPDTVQSDIPLAPYFLLLVGLSVVFAWIYNSTGGSVLLVTAMHAGFNASVGSVFLNLPGAEVALYIVLCCVVTWVMVGVLVLTFGQRTLSNPSQTPASVG